MKRYLLVILFVMAFKFGDVKSQPVHQHGQLRVEGANIIDQHGQKVALKGVSLGWYNWWPQYYNASVIEHLSRKWKISVIRAAMGVEPAGGYLEKPIKSKALIKTVIDAAIDYGIYVIVDWHSHDIYTEQAEDFFSGIAQEYASYPNLIYEIFNEPEDRTWEEIKDFSIRVIEAIRKYDERNLIIVGTPNWSHDVDVVSKEPIEGYNNIVYSLHFYAASHNYVRYKAEYAVRMLLPMFVTECSPSEADGDGKLDKKRFSDWLEFMERNSISFVMWGLYDKEESSAMLSPGADYDGGWSWSQLTKMGIYTRRIMRGNIVTPGTITIVCTLLIAVIAFISIWKNK